MPDCEKHPIRKPEFPNSTPVQNRFGVTILVQTLGLYHSFFSTDLVRDLAAYYCIIPAIQKNHFLDN